MINIKNIYPELKYNYLIDEESNIINSDNYNKPIKPFKDKRRENECPIIYLKNIYDKRLMIYHDRLMCEVFLNKPKNDIYPIIHLNGDINDCSLSNLYVADDGLDILKNIYKESKEWKPVDIDIKLYYNYFICEDGRLYNASTNSFIKPFRDNREDKYHEGYLRYNLYIGKSSQDIIHFSVGRLVALHFIPKPENKNIVMYKDSDYSNIDKSNLYWGDNYDAVMKKYDSSELNRTFNTLDNVLFGKEKWKDLEYFDVKFAYDYKISNYGRVYNMSKKFYCSQVNSTSNKLNQSYKHVRLYIYNKNEIDKFNVSVHRLVAFNFVKNDNWDKNIVVNHINGNPEFNFAFNLEWCTVYENIHHAIETNLIETSRFSNVKDEFWRLKVFDAWIFGTIKNISINKAYEFYLDYRNKFNDLPLDLSITEFEDQYEKFKDDEDFIKLFKFYSENY